MSLARQQLLGVAGAGQQSQLSSHPISPSTGASFINQQLESLSAEQLEALLEDEEAFRQFMIKHVSETQAAKTLQDIASRNRALAQENLDMQASIQEARNHVAVVKSSEFTGARNSFAELQARQAAVTDTLGSQALMALLVKEVDKLDAKSGALHDAFLTGELTADAFVEQYLVQRTAYHNLDIKRQVAEYSLS